MIYALALTFVAVIAYSVGRGVGHREWSEHYFEQGRQAGYLQGRAEPPARHKVCVKWAERLVPTNGESN